MDGVKETRRPLDSYRQTVSEIFRLAKTYFADLEGLRHYDFIRYYGHVLRLPYIRDPKGVETVCRPRYTLRVDWPGPRDCDDKTVLIGAWCESNGHPWRVVVVGKGERPHHVYPEVYFSGVWIAVDATYPDRCRLGKRLYAEKFREVFEK